VAFGLKLAFGDHVHCFFAEPTHSPMLLGVHTGLHDAIAVQDLGIDNLTAADGLAVGRASGFVGRAMERLLAGFYTLSDQEMYDLLGLLARAEQIRLEPSALAGMAGPGEWRPTLSGRWAGAGCSQNGPGHPPGGPPAAAWCPPRRWKSTWPAPDLIFFIKPARLAGFSLRDQQDGAAVRPLQARRPDSWTP
jgi:hypothetical protein